ncbi:MAG TPA: hypothetical protein VK982_10450, partial [Bacteroidales bacterium]|nr:hypothetical protein [Bacteroidales bacterium]
MMTKTVDDVFGLVKQLDWFLKYRKERKEFVDKLIDDNKWVYELLSSAKVKSTRIKKTTDFLSEDQRLDRAFEYMAIYIAHPKFEDKDEDSSYNVVSRFINKLSNMKNKDDKYEKALDILLNFNGKIEHRVVKDKRTVNKQNNRIDSSNTLKEFENNGEIVFSESDILRIKRRINKDDRKYDYNYFIKMGYSEKEAEFRSEVIQCYQDVIDDISKKRKETNDFLSYIEENDIEIDNSDMETIKNTRKLNSIVDGLHQDLFDSKKILSDEIKFNNLVKDTTVYNYDLDTWYEDEYGDIVDLSQNSIDFTEKNTYSALIDNYFDLKEKYKYEHNDDMWAILMVFEDLIKNTEFTKREAFILNLALNSYQIQEMIDEYEIEFDDKANTRMIS